jgi:hypothetical protein
MKHIATGLRVTLSDAWPLSDGKLQPGAKGRLLSIVGRAIYVKWDSMSCPLAMRIEEVEELYDA